MLPQYGKDRGGNATRVYEATGEIYEDTRRISTIVKNAARYYSADLDSIRKSYGEKLGCTHNVPLPLGMGMVLVPFKMRKPHTRKDGATGYVNLCAVEDIIAAEPEEKEEGIRCHLLLKSGLRVPSFCSVKNTADRLRKGRLARERYYFLNVSGRENSFKPGTDRSESNKLNRINFRKGLLFRLIPDEDLLEE